MYMKPTFSLSAMQKLFPTDDSCIEEVKKLRFPKGITCSICKTATKHYKVKNRTCYECEYCRHQVYPLKGTVFEKTSTPLSVWFYCLYLMTQMRARIPITTLQKELKVTYKTAWRMFHKTKVLMKKNNADLLVESQEVLLVNFFNSFDLHIVEKKEKL